MRVSQAYLILYAYHLMSKVNIVNGKEETGAERRNEDVCMTKLDKTTEPNEFLFLLGFVFNVFHVC